jgi:hypothetical protein
MQIAVVVAIVSAVVVIAIVFLVAISMAIAMAMTVIIVSTIVIPVSERRNEANAQNQRRTNQVQPFHRHHCSFAEVRRFRIRLGWG